MQLSAAPGGGAAARSGSFDLWIFPQQTGAGVSFGAGAVEDVPGAIWRMEVDSRLGPAASLAQLRRRVAALEGAVEAAPARLEAALSRQPSAQAFSLGGPEQVLVSELAAAQGGVSFGPGAPDWGALRERCTAMFDTVNRRLLHLVWVETTLDGALAARTVAGWGGDISTCTRSGLPAGALDAHRRSFDLAMQARLTMLRAAFTTIQLAGRVALLAAAPLAPGQALALAWQFVELLMAEN